MKGFRTITGATTQEVESKIKELMEGGEDGWRQVNPNRPYESQTRHDTGQVEYMAYMIQD